MKRRKLLERRGSNGANDAIHVFGPTIASITVHEATTARLVAAAATVSDEHR
jgi:hypothetical protein